MQPRTAPALRRIGPAHSLFDARALRLSEAGKAHREPRVSAGLIASPLTPRKKTRTSFRRVQDSNQGTHAWQEARKPVQSGAS